MRGLISVGSILFLLVLSACTPKPQPEQPPAEELPVVKEKPVVKEEPPKEERETQNVTYRGVVRPAGISIYIEGSHKLMLQDGRFILLEAEDLDLNGYVGEEVEALGAIRPTVEAGGIIMRVKSIKLVEKEEEEEEPADETAKPAETDSEVTDEAIPEVPEAAEEPTEVEEVSEAEPTEALEESAVVEEPEAPEPEEVAPEMQEIIDAMAKQDFNAPNWTQQYCTPHIGFCIPVHRNWWYRSFGATSSYLWHVELSSEEVKNIGDAPLTVNLSSGTVASKKATDGQVRTDGSQVIGFRSWTENRHFEITAPAALQEAVRYMTDNLVSYEPEKEE